jgi:fructose-1,6-bisphosphatase-3
MRITDLSFARIELVLLQMDWVCIIGPLKSIPMKYTDFTTDELKSDLRFLSLLSDRFPSVQAASTEIINLEAILRLPKGTEHFLTDIHGEYETFTHVIRNASGVVRRKIEDVFANTIRNKEKDALATLIYYPEEKLSIVSRSEIDLQEWYMVTLQRLSMVARAAASKYTRSKIRKSMPKDFSYIIDELLNERTEKNKQEYYNEIIKSIIAIERAKQFIVAFCHFIQRLMIDRLHIIGDIYDRGPFADKVMESIDKHHSVDIQWGNHDIVWMGAAAGIKAYIATVLRISARYENLDTIEDAYGINLIPLATFAMKYYGNDNCDVFTPKSDRKKDGKSIQLVKQMHKAISIIQFKLEAQIVKRNPQFKMSDRLLLEHIDYEKGSILIDGKNYELLDKNFPTIDPKNPYKLNEDEENLIDLLQRSFLNSEVLQRHIKVLYSKGNMFLTYNGNLLYHGCIPMTDKGDFASLSIEGKEYKGKQLLEKFDIMARRAYFDREKSNGTVNQDYLWYLWCGPESPLFGKMKMATFERYFLAEKETHREDKNPYYKFRDDEKSCKDILRKFDLDPEKSHIINGHVPVKAIKGESPIKANGKLLVIDGGMSIPYQKVTGLKGYTLIYNSYGLVLVEHNQFHSLEEAINKNKDIISSRKIVETNAIRKRVGDTDIGKELKRQIHDLKMLLAAYKKGFIKEKI